MVFVLGGFLFVLCFFAFVFFAYGCADVPLSFVEKTILTPLNCFEHLCQKSVECVGLFLGLFCSLILPMYHDYYSYTVLSSSRVIPFIYSFSKLFSYSFAFPHKFEKNFVYL